MPNPTYSAHGAGSLVAPSANLAAFRLARRLEKDVPIQGVQMESFDTSTNRYGFKVAFADREPVRISIHEELTEVNHATLSKQH